MPHSKRTFIHIVPRSLAEPNGVADYASALAAALSSYNIDSVFLSATPSVSASSNRGKLFFLRKRSSQALVEALRLMTRQADTPTVLLHFSGYGYEKRGVPLWLVRGLRTWTRCAEHVPVFTVFHELFATGRPWQSAYWLSPVQKLIARSILELSTKAITPTTLFRNWLVEQKQNAQVQCMPVFSNVGEPGPGAAPGERDAAAVVFGLAGVESRIFGTYRPDLERIVGLMGIKQIIDIGPRHGAIPRTLAGVPVVSKGALPRHAVSELLNRARFGFVAYPFDVIGKSGAFAAYAAHGVIPIVFPERRGSFDRLEPGQHFLDGLGLQTPIGLAELASIQQQLSSWYELHALPVQALFLARTVDADGSDGLTDPVAGGALMENNRSGLLSLG